MVALSKRRAQLTEARKSLTHVRALRDTLERKCAEVRAQTHYTEAYRAEQQRQLRSEFKQQAAEYLKQRRIDAELKDALASRSEWTREAIIARARFTPGTSADVLATAVERRQLEILDDIREQSTATRWITAITQPHADLLVTFDRALKERRLAICALVLQEADGRAARAKDTTLSDAELMRTAEDRALPHRLRRLLDEADIPEATDATQIFDGIEQMPAWIDSALSAFDTGDDSGARAQRVFELHQKGETDPAVFREQLAAVKAA